MAAGGFHTVALKNDGTLVAVGNNSYGQLGLGRPTHSAVPVQVVALGEIRAIAAGVFHTVALKQDGTVWAWGWNELGQLGDGTYERRGEAVLVVNETIDGPLDLVPEIPNNIPADKIPPFFLATYKSGDLSATTLAVDVRGIPSVGSLAAGVSPLAAGDYNVYVAASVPSGGVLYYYQLESSNVWGPLVWPMADFMRGQALGSQDALIRVHILQNVDVRPYIGTSILVGYGMSPDEMLASARYRTIYTVPQPVSQP